MEGEKIVFPAFNFINIKRANFTYESAFWQLFLLTCNCQKVVRTKNAHVKRWWNWHLFCLSPLCKSFTFEWCVWFLIVKLFRVEVNLLLVLTLFYKFGVSLPFWNYVIPFHDYLTIGGCNCDYNNCMETIIDWGRHIWLQ